MSFLYGKIFQKKQTNKDRMPLLKIIEYFPETQNYYSFLEDQCQQGYKQMIISSRMMISLLEKYFEQNADIVEILFMEDDEELTQMVEKLLTKLKASRDEHVFERIIQRLKHFCNEECIEIQEIKIKYKSSVITIKSNGIVMINEKSYLQEKNDIESKILNVLDAV
jgi:hypothetical protein